MKSKEHDKTIDMLDFDWKKNFVISEALDNGNVAIIGSSNPKVEFILLKGEHRLMLQSGYALEGEYDEDLETYTIEFDLVFKESGTYFTSWGSVLIGGTKDDMPQLRCLQFIEMNFSIVEGLTNLHLLEEAITDPDELQTIQRFGEQAGFVALRVE